jgi:hypothetical protein
LPFDPPLPPWGMFCWVPPPPPPPPPLLSRGVVVRVGFGLGGGGGGGAMGCSACWRRRGGTMPMFDHGVCGVWWISWRWWWRWRWWWWWWCGDQGHSAPSANCILVPSPKWWPSLQNRGGSLPPDFTLFMRWRHAIPVALEQHPPPSLRRGWMSAK